MGKGLILYVLLWVKGYIIAEYLMYCSVCSYFIFSDDKDPSSSSPAAKKKKGTDHKDKSKKHSHKGKGKKKVLKHECVSESRLKSYGL